MRVKDIMNSNVRVAAPDTLVRDVALLMCFNKISGVPVVDTSRRIIGIISEKDILFGMYPKMDEVMQADRYKNLEALESDYSDVLDLRVADLMTRKVVTVDEDAPILRAASIMFLYKIRRVPVVDGDARLAGIVSMGDVHKAVFKEAFDRRFGKQQKARDEARGKAGGTVGVTHGLEDNGKPGRRGEDKLKRFF